MKDELPNKPNKNESGVLNLENSYQNGSHWVCWIKKNKLKFYFDSYGDANPPKELVNYLGEDNLYYNENRIQNYSDPPICGHLCLKFLKIVNNIKKTDQFLPSIRNVLENLSF